MKIPPDQSSPEPPAPMASAKGDLRQLKQNTNATVAELKSFLQQLKGKSPQEMLGVVAGSQLVRAICLSTILVAVAAVVFTAVPFALGAGKNQAEEQARQEKPAPPSTPPQPAPAPAPPAAPAQPAPTPPDLSRLGVGEEKKAPPNENPLDNKQDDFLEGLD